MRSIHIQQPLEHQIEVDGESWNQGEVVKGQIRIRNMSSKTVAVKTSQIILAHGLKKAFKEGTVGPWEVIEKQVLAQDIDLFESSDIVIVNESIIFSNQREIFSFNLNNGYTNWRTGVSSATTPIVDGKNVFLLLKMVFL